MNCFRKFAMSSRIAACSFPKVSWRLVLPALLAARPPSGEVGGSTTYASLMRLVSSRRLAY